MHPLGAGQPVEAQSPLVFIAGWRWRRAELCRPNRCPSRPGARPPATTRWKAGDERQRAAAWRRRRRSSARHGDLVEAGAGEITRPGAAQAGTGDVGFPQGRRRLAPAPLSCGARSRSNCCCRSWWDRRRPASTAFQTAEHGHRCCFDHRHRASRSAAAISLWATRRPSCSMNPPSPQSIYAAGDPLRQGRCPGASRRSALSTPSARSRRRSAPGLCCGRSDGGAHRARHPFRSAMRWCRLCRARCCSTSTMAATRNSGAASRPIAISAMKRPSRLYVPARHRRRWPADHGERLEAT